MKYEKSHFNEATYWPAQIAATKKYGHTYVHAAMRAGAVIDGIKYSVYGFGRSLETKNGHKYKVIATQVES